MAEVFFADEQTERPVDGPHLVGLARFVLDEEHVSARAEVSVIAVDAETMTEFNSRFLGKDGPTDVLSFPIEEGPWDAQAEESGNDCPILLGDVMLCPEVAHRNAPEHAGTYAAELELLVVHGLLHLLGYDHIRDDDADKMEARERELLAEYARLAT